MMGEYDRPVEADPETLAHLLDRLDADLDSRELAEYARTLGLEPPHDPPGYQGWAIIEKFPDDDFDHGVLYWWGPEEDHAEEPRSSNNPGGVNAPSAIDQIWQWPLELKLTAPTENIVVLCHNHHQAVDALDGVGQGTDMPFVVQAKFMKRADSPELDFVATEEPEQLQYWTSNGAWARTLITNFRQVQDFGEDRLQQRIAAWMQAKSTFLEFIYAEGELPPNGDWEQVEAGGGRTRGRQ